MSGKSRGISKVAAAILIFINILTMLLCMFVFAISLWVIASPSSLINIARGFGNTTMMAFVTEESLSLQLGISGALLAGFFFCISFMGLYGAVSGSQFLLFMYATLLVLLLLLECSLTYYFTSNLAERGFQKQDIQLNHVLRTALQCCDRNNSTVESQSTLVLVDTRLHFTYHSLLFILYCCPALSYGDICLVPTLNDHSAVLAQPQENAQ